MKKCAIIANGYFHGDSMVDQVKSLQGKLEKLNINTDIIYTDRIIVVLSSGAALSTIGDYDFIVFLDKDPYISHLLEKAGYRLFNSATAIELCDDKMKTYCHLANSGIKIPDTIASPLNYAQKEDALYFDIENLIGYPVVIKNVFGSMGNSVYLAKTREQLKTIRKSLIATPHLYQRFVGRSGYDIRVIVVGGKAVGAMERINDKDFRSNIEQGGVGRALALNDKIVEISCRCAQLLGLDYCGVDLLWDGVDYYLSEVNSNAFFKGFRQATGIDVALLYAQYLDNITG